jgi:hypothetical protein
VRSSSLRSFPVSHRISEVAYEMLPIRRAISTDGR